jgi:hypothetical protein
VDLRRSCNHNVCEPHVDGAVQARHETARFPDEQHACGKVLHRRATDPDEAVELSCGHARKFKRDRRPKVDRPDAPLERFMDRVPTRLLLGGRYRWVEDDAGLAPRPLHELEPATRPVVRAEPVCRRPTFVGKWAAGGADNRSPVNDQRRCHGDKRIAANEVCGAVDRIDDPKRGRVGVTHRTFDDYGDARIGASEDVGNGDPGRIVDSRHVFVVQAAD